MIILQAEWSQRPVLKSNLQTPTWLLPISHGLFITAITSPHIFILLLLHCCWPALLSLFLHLADLTSLPPSRLPFFFWFTATRSAHSSLFSSHLPQSALTSALSFRPVPIFPFPSVNAFIPLPSICNYKSDLYTAAQQLSSVTATLTIFIHFLWTAGMIRNRAACIGAQRVK